MMTLRELLPWPWHRARVHHDANQRRQVWQRTQARVCGIELLEDRTLLAGLSDPTAIVTPADIPLQPVGVPFVDTPFGTSLRRVSNTSDQGGFETQIYSQLQAFSSDNAYLLLTGSNGYVVRRVSDLSLVAGLNTDDWNVPRWHPTQPHVLLHFDTNADTDVTLQFTNVDTGVTTDVVTLPLQYQFILGNQSFDEVSDDGRWVTGMLTRDDGQRVIFALDMISGSLGAVLPVHDLYTNACQPDPTWGEVEPDWIAGSPLGRYLVVQWPRDGTRRCSGLETFNAQSGEFVGRVYDGHQHGDLGVLPDGTTEFFMTFELSGPPPDTGRPALATRLLPGTSTVSPPNFLTTLDWGNGDHISCRGPNGTCLVTAGGLADNGWNPFEEELYLQRTDGTVLRLAHHRSTRSDYWVQPRASISRDGRYVVFASDWGRATDGRGDPYLIDLESDATSCSPTVTHTGDDGSGSLRAAIVCANSTPGIQTINFNIPGAGPHTIQPLSPLPNVTTPVIIDGTTEPNFVAGGPPVMELNGDSAGANASGLKILSGGSTVRGLTINRFSGAGIELRTGGGNLVVGDFIGTDSGGTLDQGNARDGVSIVNSANNTIGGTSAAARNVISGNNWFGVEITNGTSTGNVVQGNYIGTNAAGTAAIGNSLSGVTIYNAPSNTIGGTAAGAVNVISGNVQNGVYLALAGAAGNLVQGNRIGTNAGGTADLGNTLSGVLISGAASNTIGGPTAAARNIISGNDQHGVFLLGAGTTNNQVQGNYIGTNVVATLALGNTLAGVRVANVSSNIIGGSASGTGNTIAYNGQNGVRIAGPRTGNQILRNSIFLNTGLGIDLNGDGVTANDVNDPDAGANKLQNFPVITSAVLSGGNLTVTYSVPSIAPNSAYPLRVEFFIADSAGQEGKTLLRADSYAAPGTRMNTFAAGGAVLGSKIVATATDASGNTSEFSAAVTVASPLLVDGSLRKPEFGSRSEPATLTSARLQPIVAAAIARLAEQGLSAEQVRQLSSVTFAIADFSGATLGLASPTTITLDTNAAGYGWFVDPTPQDDSEFTAKKMRTPTASLVSQRIDLLTAVMHELGHVLGHNDLDPSSHHDDLMSATLAPGTRRTSYATAVDEIFAEHALWATK